MLCHLRELRVRPSVCPPADCPRVGSYPALLPLPCHISDMSAAKVARCHRHGRLPVATWKHPRTRALLLRGSAFYGKGVRGIIMAHQATSEATGEGLRDGGGLW